MEILGSNLELAFEELRVDAIKTYETADKSFQVWDIDEGEYSKLVNIPDEQWKNEYGWWRNGRCTYEGTANIEYDVNGEIMMGYSIDDEDDDSILGYKFSTYTDWLSEAMNLSTIKNISIFATSLATDNNMTLSEFMNKYQP